MSQLPSLTGREVIAALGKIGFDVARVRGSHHINQSKLKVGRSQTS
ncbi:type II toxin-antitoxin system HicA family toxin [Nostoc sp. NOS(2021)]|nr:type II toxin-antitoxin system HicA family toxin [Nostoc sp. NOS(2021)]